MTIQIKDSKKHTELQNNLNVLQSFKKAFVQFNDRFFYGVGEGSDLEPTNFTDILAPDSMEDPVEDPACECESKGEKWGAGANIKDLEEYLYKAAVLLHRKEKATVKRFNDNLERK